MNRTIAAQAVSLSLALVVTVSTLMALNSLASTEHAVQQQQIAAAKHIKRRIAFWKGVKVE